MGSGHTRLPDSKVTGKKWCRVRWEWMLAFSSWHNSSWILAYRQSDKNELPSPVIFD